MARQFRLRPGGYKTDLRGSSTTSGDLRGGTAFTAATAVGALSFGGLYNQNKPVGSLVGALGLSGSAYGHASKLKKGGTAGSGSSNTLGTTLTIPVTTPVPAGSSVIIPVLTTGSATTLTITDTVGNHYTTDGSSSNGTVSTVYLASSHNVQALGTSDSITITCASAKQSRVAVAEIYSGLPETSTVVEATLTRSSSGSSTSLGAGALNTAQDYDVMVVAWGVDGTVNENTALTAYATDTTSSTLSTAKTASNIAPSAETSHQTQFQNATGWDTITAGGSTAAWAAGSSEPGVSTHGYLLDSTLLEGQTLAAGSFTPSVKVHVVTAGITATFVVRVWKRSSAGGYIRIGHYTSASLTFSNVDRTINTWTEDQACAGVPFATGDKLYYDIAVNVTSNTAGNATNAFTVSQNGGIAESLITPGYVGALPGFTQDSVAHSGTTSSDFTVMSGHQIQISKGTVSASMNVDVASPYSSLMAIYSEAVSTLYAKAIAGLTFSGTARAQVSPSAQGGLAFGGTATATGKIAARAAGALAFSGTTTSVAVRRVTATGGLALSGTAAVRQLRAVSAAGGLAFSGVAAGGIRRAVSATGTLAFSGSAAGTVAHNTRSADAVGALGFSGSVSGAVRRASGATGALGFTGSATAHVLRTAASSGALSFAGSVGTQLRLGARALGALGLSGAVVTHRSWAARASGALGLSGTLSGTRTWAARASGALGLQMTVGFTYATAATGAVAFTGSARSQISYATSGTGNVVLGGSVAGARLVPAWPASPAALVLGANARAQVAYAGSSSGLLDFSGLVVPSRTWAVTALGALVLSGKAQVLAALGRDFEWTVGDHVEVWTVGSSATVWAAGAHQDEWATGAHVDGWVVGGNVTGWEIEGAALA